MKSVRKRHAKRNKPAISLRRSSVSPGNGSSERDKLIGELELELTRLKMQQQEMAHGRQSAEEVAGYYANLFNAAPAGYVVFNPAGVILEINQAGADLLRRKLKDIKGKPFAVFLAEEQAAIFLNHLRRCGDGKQVVTNLVLQLPVRGSVPVELVSTVTNVPGNLTQFRTVMMDISDRKRAEQISLAAERSYRNLVNSIEGIVWEGSEQPGIFTFVSGQAQQMLGYSPERWMREPEFWENHLHPEDRKRVLKTQSQAVAEKKGYLMEFRMFDSRRRIVWLRDTAHVIRNPQGRVRLQGVMVNITELKEAEEALREETRMLETINRIGTLLIGQLDLTKLVASIAEVGKQVTGAKFGAFFYQRHEGSGDVPAVYITPGATAGTFEHLPLPRHHPGTSPAEAEREAIRIDDLLDDAKVSKSVARKRSAKQREILRSYLAVPVVSRSDEVLGGLLFGHTAPGVFTERAQHLLAGIAAEAGIALDNARLYRAVSKSESHFRQLADAMPQIVWTAQADGRVNYFNRRWYEYTGMPAGALKEDGWLAFLHPDDRGPSMEGWKKSLATGAPFEVECRLRDCRTGNYRWHLVRAAPNTDTQERAAAWFGTSTDIEDQKRVEGEIREMNAALERRVAERTAQLQASNRELEAFSYSVSHDLRAPLRSIDAFSQLVREDYEDKLDEQGKEYLGIVGNASRQMGQLIDDLLHLSRVTRSEMRRVPVDLSALAEGTLANLRQLEPKRKVETVVSPGLQAQGDGQLLRVVLENLLNNAWKFTSRRPDARIEVGAEMHDGKQVIFVRDNGAGFDMCYSSKLFMAFQRLHSTSEFPGHGIGLATVQRIIHRHGGRIWANAAVDRGATFYFTLPQ